LEEKEGDGKKESADKDSGDEDERKGGDEDDVKEEL